MKPLAVYVHIPFCLVKCGYCDFNTYARLDHLKPAYGRALLAEVASWRGLLASRAVTSISFGGGTPCEFPVDSLVAVVEAIRAAAGGVANDVEVSLEANPGSTAPGALSALAAAGVNRISFGAQSFDAAELRFLDRTHSPGDIVAAVRAARSAGIESVGIDLIYGLPGQPPTAWRANLERAAGLGVDHISCYALTVEPNTPLARRVATGEVVEADPDLVAGMYESAEQLLNEAGYTHYEISNWARPGHESRHNTVYWTGGDYLGIGAGAHSFLAGERLENVASPKVYINRLADPDPPPRAAVAHSYRPHGAAAAVDWLEARLRLCDGFPLAEMRVAIPPALLDEAESALSAFADVDLVAIENGVVRLTARGRLLHMEVCARLLARLTAG